MITLLNKFDDNYIIKEKDVLEIASSYIKANNLDSYLKDIIFDENATYTGYYNLLTKEIVFNTQKLFHPEYDVFNDLKTTIPIDEKYHSYFINYHIMSIIYHELFHVNQRLRYEMNIDNSNDIFIYLYKLCTILQNNDKMGYYGNSNIHDLYPMEREATNNAILTTHNLMSYTKLPVREVKIMQLLYLTVLVSEYKKHSNHITSPIEILAKTYKEIDLKKIVELTEENKLSKIERLNYGLSITMQEYQDIQKDKDKKIMLLLKK